MSNSAHIVDQSLTKTTASAFGQKQTCSINAAGNDALASVQHGRKSKSNGLPDLLPVAPRSSIAVSHAPAPAGYILVPAAAVSIQQVVPTNVANVHFVSAINSQPTPSGSTIVVVSNHSFATQLATINEKSSRPASSHMTSADGNVTGVGGRCFVDSASLYQTMGRNKESLKRKLLQRSSRRELVERGILPPPRTPPSYYEQRLKLERAKMSDILKHKIQHRPDRQQLVSQHILMENCADAGILEKQHQQKKCKLADNLNEKLSTLTVHEEALRHQQKKIEEIQNELQKSQDLLRQQQQMILAAKQMQSEANEGAVSETECILSQLDTKQIQKAHIQLFLQQKIQQHQLQQQINVQQELMEIQQKLQEEMTVHQALSEVVRLLREEPRMSILVLYLLRRHQMQQQQQQQQKEQAPCHPSEPQPPAPTTTTQRRTPPIQANGKSMGKRSEATRQSACLAGQLQQSPAAQSSPSPASVSPPGRIGQYDSGHSCGSESSASPGDASGRRSFSKNRQGSGQQPKKSTSQSSIARANSVPTSPAKSKSSSSMGDMEEIFRTVLDHASKATAKCGESMSPNEPQRTQGALPSFDQLLQRSRPVSEIETAISITSGSGVFVSSSHNQQQQLSMLDHLPTTTAASACVRGFLNGGDAHMTKCTTAVNETTQPAASFMYTRNEAFDDLMEVLRNNDAVGFNDGSVQCANGVDPANAYMGNKLVTPGPPSSAVCGKGETVGARPNQQLQLSAYGAQEVADLLSTEWFNVESLLPQTGAAAGVPCTRASMNATHAPDANVFSNSAVPSNGRMGNKASERPTDLPTNADGSVVLVSADMSEQMDWLDLILPSPSTGGSGILHELPIMNCLPMETDCISGTACDSGDTDSLSNTVASGSDFGSRRYSQLATSTHNPVLSACVSGEAM